MSQNKTFTQDRHQSWVLYQPENMSLFGVKPGSYMEVYGDLCRWPWCFHVGLIPQSLSLLVGKVHYTFVCFDNFWHKERSINVRNCWFYFEDIVRSVALLHLIVNWMLNYMCVMLSDFFAQPRELAVLLESCAQCIKALLGTSE